MEYRGLEIVKQLREMPIQDIVEATPRDISVLAEQAKATIEPPKFFDFDKAEELGLPKAQVAKEIEKKALKGEVQVPFNFNKFHAKLGDNYEAMYDFLKITPQIKAQKEARKVKSYIKQAIRDRAKEALDAGEIDRATFNQVYRKAHTSLVKQEAIESPKWTNAVEETFAGAMQDALGFIKVAVDTANSLGADIEDTGLQANITHYKNAMQELRKASGDAGNGFLTYQNLGSFILSLGALSKVGVLSSADKTILHKARDVAINSALFGGMGYASAIGRGEGEDEAVADGIMAGAIGGIGGTVLLHSIQEIFTPKFNKLEESLKHTLNLTDAEVEEAAKNYAKYMDIDPNTSEARVKGILTTYGTNIAGAIRESATSSNRLVNDLQNFVKTRKDYLFDILNKDTLDTKTFLKHIDEANTLAQLEWGKAMNHIKEQWNSEINLDIKGYEKVLNPEDYLYEATRKNVSIVKEALENPRIETLMEADKALNNILSTKIKDASKAYKLKEIQKNIQDTIQTGLKTVGREDLWDLYVSTKDMYKTVATAKNSKLVEILKKDISEEAKLKMLRPLANQFKDMNAIAEVVGEAEAYKLEKLLLKSALKSNKQDTLGMSWNMIFNSVGKKALVTKEGKALQQFIADMDKWFKLDDLVLQNTKGKSSLDDLGLRQTFMGTIKASFIGRFAKYVLRHIQGLWDKNAYHDYNLSTFLEEVYTKPDKIKAFRDAVENMNPSLLEKLKNDSWYGGDIDLGGVNPNKPKSPNNDKGGGGNYLLPPPASMYSPEAPTSIGHDIALDNTGKFKSAYDKPKFTIIKPKINAHLRDTFKLDTHINNLKTLFTKYKYNPVEQEHFINAVVNKLTAKELQPLLEQGMSEAEAKYLITKEIQQGLLQDTKDSLVKLVKVRPDIEQQALLNPAKELDLFNSDGVYFDLFGQAKAIQPIDNALKELQQKGVRFIHSEDKPKVELKDDIVTIYGDNEVARKLSVKLNSNPTVEEVKEALKFTPKVPKDKVLGDLEEYILAKGVKVHPMIDIINRWGDKILDYTRVNEITKKEPIFKIDNDKMLFILNKVKNKEVGIEDLPELRKFIALKILNPTYINNPFVADRFGLQVNWGAVPKEKMNKYLEDFREAKFFGVLAGIATLTGILNAQPVTVEQHIKKYEDIRLKPYKDSRGYWTIGYGHKLNSKELSKYKNGITKKQAEELFKKDLGWVKSRLKANIPNYNSLAPEAKLVLQDLAFNLGITKLLKFRKFLGYINSRNYKEASRELLNSKYAEQVSVKANKNASMLRGI